MQILDRFAGQTKDCVGSVFTKGTMLGAQQVPAQDLLVLQNCDARFLSGCILTKRILLLLSGESFWKLQRILSELLLKQALMQT